jgi:hypothetical protein
MIDRLRRTDGYAIPIAIMLMAIMLTFGVAALAFVDQETDSSRRERTHEARLNLTEGVLAAQIFQLSRGWPGESGKALPDACTEASAAPLCPQPSQLKGQFGQVDFSLNPTWTVHVRDDDTGQHYTDTTVLGGERWDANGNGEMWVRAEGRLQNTHRIVVARVRVEKRPLTPPTAPFVAGSFQTGNNGTKVIIESTLPGIVRCPTTGTNDSCVDYESGQIAPVNNVVSDPDRGSVLVDGMVDALKQQAISKGTYYPTCPADPSGEVVFVESGNCKYQGNMQVNGTTKRGVFVINNGTLELSGGVQWWGLIYALNAQGCSPTSSAGCLNAGAGASDGVVEITGTVTVTGGIFVEGEGRLSTGNSGGNGSCANCQPNLVYNPGAAVNITAHGTAGIIQNTWRELLRG